MRNRRHDLVSIQQGLAIDGFQIGNIQLQLHYQTIERLLSEKDGVVLAVATVYLILPSIYLHNLAYI